MVLLTMDERMYHNELKVEIGRFELEHLLQPRHQEVIQKTANPDKLARSLFYKGVMSDLELQRCLGRPTKVSRNRAIYQILADKNAGVALVDALLKTGNFHIIQLIDPRNNFASNQQQPPSPSDLIQDDKPIVEAATSKVSETTKPSTASTIEPNPSATKISILKTKKWTPATSYNAWIPLIGEDYLSKLKEDDWHSTLARVVTNIDSSSGNSSIHQTTEFHPEEEGIAIIKFLESTLELDLDKKTMGRPLREIYINTRSFTHVEWDFLSKMLLLCRDSLEKLWLEKVDYKEYFYGTTWMENLVEDEQHLKFNSFSKLNSFIFERNHENLSNSSDTFQRILALIKPPSYSLEDLWNKSKCRIQIWSDDFTWCHILMDPKNRTLFLGSSARAAFKDQVGKLFTQTTIKSHIDQAPLVKLYYIDPPPDLIADGLNGWLLTHLFLRSWQANNMDVFQSVMDNLAQFPLLQKLLLSADHPWKIDLNQLDALNNLRFVYLRNAKCGRVAVENFPWRKSVRTIMLNRCTECTLKTPGLEAVLPNDFCVMLERSTEQNVLLPSEPFNVSILSTDQLWIETVREFCSD